MKYIKLLENVELSDATEFAKNCLVDLIDKEFIIQVLQLTGYYMVKVTREGNNYIKWEEIKDEFEFFVEVLKNDYQLVGKEPFCILGKTLTLDEFYDIENMKEYTWGHPTFKYAAIFFAKK